MSKFSIAENAKVKTPLSMRWMQMSKQEQIIEKKKMEIQAKVEAQRKAAHAAKLMAKADEVKGDGKVTAANIFSNDGSFLDQFKKLVENNDPPQETAALTETEGVKDQSLKEPSSSEKPTEPKTLEVASSSTDKPKEETRSEDKREQRKDFKNNDRRFDRGDRSQRHWNANDRGSGGSRQQDNQQYSQQHPPKLSIPSLMQNPVMPPGMRQYSPAPPIMNSSMYQNNQPFSPMQHHPNDSGNNKGNMGNANFPPFPPPFNIPRPNFMPPLPGQSNAPPPVNNAPMLPSLTPSFLTSNVPPPNVPPPPTNFSTGPPNFSSSAPTLPNFSPATAPPNFSSASAPPNFSSTSAPPNFSAAPTHPNCSSALTPPNFSSPAPPPCNMPTHPPPFPFMMLPNFAPPLPLNPTGGNMSRINQSPADSMALPPPQSEPHTIPPPGMLKQIPKAELDICNVPPPQIAVLSADTRVTPAMEDAAKQVARTGPLWESMLKSRQDSALWFLQDEKSVEYNLYQSLVTRYRREFTEEQQKTNNPLAPKEEKYDPEFSLHDEDSGDGYGNDNRFQSKNNRQDGDFDNIGGGGFNNRTDDGFDNGRDGGFGNRRDDGFDNRRDDGFNNKRVDAFGNRRDGTFDNRRNNAFDDRWGGGMDNKRGPGFENLRDDGFDNRRGGGFDNRRGGRSDNRRDSGFDSRQGGGSNERRSGDFENNRSGRSGDGRNDGFDNKRDSDYRRDTKFDNRRDTEFDDSRLDLQLDTKDLIGFGSHQDSNVTNRLNTNFDNKRVIKRDRNNSDSDEDNDRKAERRKKRKSRWGEGDAQSADVGLPGVACISGLGGAVVPTIVPSLAPLGGPALASRPGDPMLLSRVTRSDPALLQYARLNYGSTSLSEEEWGKCEENYKLNLLYQDMMRKKQELEKLAMAGRNKHEYDSDEDTEQGTWEHKLRALEIEATKQWATELTKRAAGKHHIGDFLPPEELKKFMEKYSAIKSGKEPDLSDYKEFKLAEDNIGFKMLQKLGWNQGSGLGAEGTGIVEPVNKASQRDTKQGLGMASREDLAAGDDEFDAYRKRMMMAYRFRPNPLNNPRRAYY